MPDSPTLVPHASLEGLLDRALDFLPTTPERSQLFPVVVPSMPFADWLKLQIAQCRGVCMGIDFLMPRDFIRHVLGPAGPGRDHPWSKQNLIWRIYPHAADLARTLGLSEPSGRDLFALAGMLADQFDQYGHFRPQMIRAWAQGKSGLPAGGAVSAEEARASEVWQRVLWSALRAEIPEPHPALEIERLSLDELFLHSLGRKVPKVLVVGTGSIDPLLVEITTILARAGCEVEVHVVLPSLGYLGECRRHYQAGGIEQLELGDPEEIAMLPGHPLIESMGRHAVGSFLLLGQLDEQYTHWPEADTTAAGDGSLLKRLQTDIRNLRQPATRPGLSSDTSIRVHSCFGPRREMEVLRNEILRAFSEIDGLKPGEIHIVTPSLEVYAPLVSAIFENGELPLPVRVTELPPAGRDAGAEALIALLRMADDGVFSICELIDLLALTAVQDALGVSGEDQSVERIADWIRNSGLTRGLTETSGEENHWEFARDRLLAAGWFGTRSDARYPDGTFVLPVADVLGGETDLRGRWQHWWRTLQATMTEWQHPASAPAWSERLARACADLLSGAEDAAVGVQQTLGFLADVQTPEVMDAGTLLDWLQGEIRDRGSRTIISGKMTLGRFNQLQSLPCRVLAMIGMRDADFPARCHQPAWDLLHAAPRVWDRNPRIDDRQMFLDALLTPTDRLIITAPTRNVRSGKDEPFSSCVDELLRTTALMGVPAEDLIIRERLQPYAECYYVSADPGVRSFNASHASVAEALSSREEKTGLPLWVPSDAEIGASTEPQELPLEPLIKFWQDPAREFIRAQGIDLPRSEDDDNELAITPLTLNSLQSWKVKDSIVRTILEDPEMLDFVQAQIRADRGLPSGALGDQVWTSNVTQTRPLGLSIREHLGRSISIRWESPDARVVVTGTLLQTQDESKLLAYRVGQHKSAKHWTDAWIRTVAAAACGFELPCALFDDENCEAFTERPSIAPDLAASILEKLVRGHQLGQSHPLTYAPETSEKIVRVLKMSSEDMALDAAAAEWSKQPSEFASGGEGHGAAASLAWRDSDPFEHGDAWIEWANAIAAPLAEWSNPGKAAS